MEYFDQGLIEKNYYIEVDENDRRIEGSDMLLMENTINVTVNGIHAGSIPHTPQHVEELVVGWLNDEGYINTSGHIDRVELSEDGSEAIVLISRKERDTELKAVTPITWRKEWIFGLAEDFEVQMPLRELTMAAHNCRLAKGKADGIDIIFKCEDIGRHSAIDKAIGWSILNGIDTTDCILFTSGRISRAMVHKVIRASIPVMAGKGTISGKAVELARENHLTLIGYSKKDSLCIFNDEVRDDY